MQKFQRNYKIVFEIGERRATKLTDYIPYETIEVSYPHTLHFNVSSGINFSNVSSGTFQLYNLSSDVQAKLWKDNFNQIKYITMSFFAGYGDNMPLVFKGDILECYTYRESGGVDFITEIKSDDGSYLMQYGVSNATFAEGTKFENLLKSLLMETPQYKLGYITPSIPPLKRDKTFIGQTMELLGKEYGGYQIFVDRGELNILDKNDVIPGDILVITAESGLLGSPRRSEQFLQVQTLFEPQVKIAQAIELISDSLPFANNIYKVVGITHNGVISPVECGKVTTSLQLYLGLNPFNELTKAFGNDTVPNGTSGRWIKPVKGGAITSYFGGRDKPTAEASSNHKGIDIGVSVGTPVYATANGTARTLVQGNGKIGFGNYVQINHGKDSNGNLLESIYGHLSRFAIGNNQKVVQGQLIAYSGGAKGVIGSGTSTGPHLHFQVNKNGKAVNPAEYIGSWG